MVRSALLVGSILAACTTAGAAQTRRHPPVIQTVPTPPPVFIPTPVKRYHAQVAIAPLPSGKETLAYGISGNWHVRIDLSLDGGCFANVVYDDGTYLRLVIAPKTKTVMVAVGNRLWRSIVSGQDYDVALSFDGKEPWTAEATGLVTTNIYYFAFRLEGPDFLQEMRSARLASIANSNQHIGNYDVRGSAAAIEKVAQCQRAVEAEVDPFAKK